MARKSTLVIGAQREGKTFFTEKMCIKYALSGGTSIAYNVGRPNDFQNFISVSLVTPDVVYSMSKKGPNRIKYNDIPQQIDSFMHNQSGKIYDIKDFCKLFKGKCVKIERLNPQKREENLFFEAIYNYFYNCLIVMDDFRAVTRHGLSSQFIQLNGRQNHTGYKLGIPAELCGVDMFMIYHSFDSVSDEMYDYINSIVQFKTASPPNLEKYNPELERILSENYVSLRELPKYSRIEIDTIDYQTHTVTP